MNVIAAEHVATSSASGSPIRALMYIFFPGGGIGRYTDHLASALTSTTRVSAEVACSPQFEYLKTADYPTWPHLSSINSRNPLLRKAKFLRSQFTSPRLAISRARQIRAEILHFSNINHLSYATWRKAALRGPFHMIATAHDVRRGVAIVNRSWETKWLVQFYRDCRALFVHSDSQKQDLLTFAAVDPDIVHVVPHGIYEYPRPTAGQDQLRQKYNIPRDASVGLFFGAIREDKNLDNLLIALANASTEQHLVIAGRPRNDEAGRVLRSHIHTLGLDRQVLLLDRFIPEEEVGDLFELSDFVALTYRSSFSSQSGVLNVAAHYHRPILTSDAPTLSETVSRHSIGKCCPGDDPESIAVGLRKMLRIEVTDQCFTKYRQCHSWEHVALATAGVYRRLTHGR